MLNELRVGEVTELQEQVSTGKEQQMTAFHMTQRQACHAHHCRKDAEINTWQIRVELSQGSVICPLEEVRFLRAGRTARWRRWAGSSRRFIPYWSEQRTPSNLRCFSLSKIRADRERDEHRKCLSAV